MQLLFIYEDPVAVQNKRELMAALLAITGNPLSIIAHIQDSALSNKNGRINHNVVLNILNIQSQISDSKGWFDLTVSRLEQLLLQYHTTNDAIIIPHIDLLGVILNWYLVKYFYPHIN
jgi:hypothetical protein